MSLFKRNETKRLALPQFLLLFAIGLDKPLSKASSGQASDEYFNSPSKIQELPPLMGTNLLNPKRYWPMKPFRRVRPSQTISNILTGSDTGRLVVKALEREPLMPNQAQESQAPFQVRFSMPNRGFPITVNHDRILKFWKLAYLPAGRPACVIPTFLFLDDLKNWGEGKTKKDIAKGAFKYYDVPVKNLIDNEGWNILRRLKWGQRVEKLW